LLCGASKIAAIGIFIPTNARTRRAVRALVDASAFPYALCRRHKLNTATSEQVEAFIVAMAELPEGRAS
jgi:hypothetical protein